MRSEFHRSCCGRVNDIFLNRIYFCCLLLRQLLADDVRCRRWSVTDARSAERSHRTLSRHLHRSRPSVHHHGILPEGQSSGKHRLVVTSSRHRCRRNGTTRTGEEIEFPSPSPYLFLYLCSVCHVIRFCQWRSQVVRRFTNHPIHQLILEMMVN